MLQLEGCRGDFCGFDVGMRVREEEKHRHFIEKAARAAGAENGLVENLSPLRLKIISMDSEDLEDGSPASTTAAAVRPDGRGPRVARHSDLNSERLDIPYKAVVQARQERPLVESFLRRYARGEDGEYHMHLDGGAGDEPYLVGGTYPGVYYRPVRVCSKCYMVYTLVDEARAQALRKVRRSRGGRGRRQHAVTPTVGLNQSACDAKAVENLPASDRELASAGNGGDMGQRRSASSPTTAGDGELALSVSNDGYEHSLLAVSLAEARQAMDVISQGDISELRSFVRPPIAVSHVASIAMSLLEGKSNAKATPAAPVSWPVARAAMGRGDFTSRLRAFDPRTVTTQQLSAVLPALERSSLDPAVVRPLSNAAGNLCLWILGVIQANRWLTGSGHVRTNTVPADDDTNRWGFDYLRKKRSPPNGTHQEQPFPQQRLQAGEPLTQGRPRWASPSREAARRKRGRVENHARRQAPSNNAEGSRAEGGLGSLERTDQAGLKVTGLATASPALPGEAEFGFGVSKERGGAADAGSATAAVSFSDRSPCKRKKNDGGRVAAQAFASGRLANAGQSALPEVATGKDFVCSDGRTRLPYRVCGDPGASSGVADSCNFVVVHDFFDNVDKTEVLFRSVTRRHRGCRVLAFSYPGQAGTVFRVPPSMLTGAPSGSRSTGSDAGRTPEAFSLPNGGGGGGRRGDNGSGGRSARRKEVPNNAFIAPRLHELLQHVHSTGEMSLNLPFHLVSSTLEA